jgi:hypothetical protein
MSAKDYAVQDIQEELTKQGKCFLAFRSELDPIMSSIVKRENWKRFIASII